MTVKNGRNKKRLGLTFYGQGIENLPFPVNGIERELLLVGTDFCESR